MNANKAQEYFSPYYEGELTGGLLDQFEHTLKVDAQVQAEYNAFAKAMQALESMKEPIPEPEFDLHEAISRRLDKHFYELDRRPKANFWTTWRKVLVGGVAAVALIGAGLSIYSRGDTNQASPIGIPSGTNLKASRPETSISSTRLSLESVNDAWTLKYRALGVETITISSADSPRKETNLFANDLLESPLSNSGDVATLLKVQSTGALNSALIALPGRSTKFSSQERSGSMGEFAVAVADAFGVPVVVLEKESEAELKWELNESTTITQISETVKNFGYSIEQKVNGVIWIL